MKCSCLKCSAPLPENLPEVPEKGKSAKCSECNSSYWIHRESFMLRCYTVAGERYCNNCGEALGQSTFCPGCGTLYPDYCVVQSKKPGQRAFEKKQFSLGLPSFGGKSTGRGQRQGLIAAGGKGGSSDLRRQLMMVGASIVLLAVIAVVALLYIRDREESTFTRKYVVALSGIKSGTDHCLKMSALLASGSRLADKDISLLKSVKGEIAASLEALSSPPEKYSDAQIRLTNLFQTYDRLYMLSVNSGPSESVATSAGTLEAQFTKQARELKDSLPPRLLEELTAMSPRYSNLQFLLK